MVLAGVMFYALWHAPGETLPSALLNKPVPRLKWLRSTQRRVASDRASWHLVHVTVVNVFASWCVPCHNEAPVIATLAGRKDFALYGLVQKDTPAKIRDFFAENGGNPFQRVALDADGRASIEWGVYGVPETFVVDGRGIVRARIVGEITEDVLNLQLLPAIKDAQG
ncbi:MAG: redoxin family protein [Rhizomicrobium sp.]